MKFYVPLPNELVRNEQSADGRRFIGWRYKPGQRIEVLVPVERWENRIVLRYGVTLHQVKAALEESNENATGGYLDQQGPNELVLRFRVPFRPA